MKTQHRIPSLDGLRAISIFFVLMGHSQATIPAQIKESLPSALGYLLKVLSNASAGVLTFFVISGYLITHLLRQEYLKTNTISLRGFYLRRTFRIFPAFYSYAALIVALVALGWLSIPATKLLSAFSFTLNYNAVWDLGASGNDYWFIGHFWTLALEEQFYLLWPLTILLLGLSKAKKIALGIILIEPLIRVSSYFLFPSLRGQIGMMLHTASGSIMIGCLISLMQGDRRFELFAKRLENGIIPVVAMIFVFLVSPALHTRFGGTYGVSAGITLEAISIALILIWVTRWPQTLLGRFLNWGPITYIGVLSYSLYLWQQLFLTPLNTTWAGKYPYNLAVCFGVAVLSYHFIEQPFLRLKNRLSKRHALVVADGA